MIATVLAHALLGGTPAHAMSPIDWGAGLVYVTCPAGPYRSVTTDGVDLTAADVSQALEDAIARATLDGLIAYLPPGTYPIASPVHVVAGATVCGAGQGYTILSASVDDKAWSEAEAMVEIVGEDGVSIHDLTLDARGDEREETVDALSFAMLLSNTVGDHIRNVQFLDNGHATSSPSAPALMMLARDPEDAPWFASSGTHLGEVGPVQSVVVEECRFEHNAAVHDWFAIRMNSSFPRPAGAYLHVNTRNTIRNNTFIGDYPWNTVEVAGAGSFGHVIEGNSFNGLSLAHVDLDKGTHGNWVEGNTVLRGGRPAELYVPLPDQSLPPEVAGFMDHGIDDNTRNFGNTIIGNVVLRMDSVYPSPDIVPHPAALTSDDAGVLLSYTDGPRVENNRIDAVYEGVRGSGIVLHVGTAGASVIGNTVGEPGVVRKVAYGIRTADDATGVTDTVLDGNVLYVGGTGIGVDGTHDPALVPGWSIVHNVVDTTSLSLPDVFLFHLDAPALTGNTTVGGVFGFQLDAPGAVATANTSSGAASYTWSIWADATLTGNHATSGGQPGVPSPHCFVGAGVQLTAVGNDFSCP